MGTKIRLFSLSRDCVILDICFDFHLEVSLTVSFTMHSFVENLSVVNYVYSFQASGESNLSFLCITYGKYLLPKVAVCSRSYNRHLLTPCVLSSVLDHCNSPELFGNVLHVVEELVIAIDQGSQVLYF